jgi:hypothetical protein
MNSRGTALSFSKSGIVPTNRRYPSEGDLKFAAPAENKAVFWKTRPPNFSPNLLEQSVSWKTLPASEFRQKARGAVQQDSARPVSIPLPTSR